MAPVGFIKSKYLSAKEIEEIAGTLPGFKTRIGALGKSLGLKLTPRTIPRIYWEATGWRAFLSEHNALQIATMAKGKTPEAAKMEIGRLVRQLGHRKRFFRSTKRSGPPRMPRLAKPQQGLRPRPRPR